MANIPNDFSIGDFMINFESIYQIVDQKEQQDISGKSVTYFCYKPVEDNHQSATYSTPINNISKSGFRHLLTKKDIDALLVEAAQKIEKSLVSDYKNVKDVIYLNNPSKNLSIVKQLLYEKNTNSKKFTKTDNDTIESIIKHLALEFSFVTKKDFNKILTQITDIIQKAALL